jgi:hypothetical protein
MPPQLADESTHLLVLLLPLLLLVPLLLLLLLLPLRCICSAHLRDPVPLQ